MPVWVSIAGLSPGLTGTISYALRTTMSTRLLSRLVLRIAFPLARAMELALYVVCHGCPSARSSSWVVLPDVPGTVPDASEQDGYSDYSAGTPCIRAHVPVGQ